MYDTEKQPLTSSVPEWDIAIPITPVDSIKTIHRENSELLKTVIYYESFEIIANNVKFNIEESHHIIEKIKNAHKQLYEHTPGASAQKDREALISQTTKLDDRLQYICNSVVAIEPSKPTLSNLDLRNRHYKALLRNLKDLLEKYINITLESQRYTSVLFEQYIKSVNPQATPFDLERAMASVGENEPSVFVQVLMQRGIRRNDKQIQEMMHIVQDVHEDLRRLSISFSTLSDMRSKVNILIERYRRRWPLILQENGHMYVIDDDLNLLERAKVGTAIDFDAILRKRESRNKLIASIITLITIIVVVGIVVSTTLFSDF
ncbi:unnamed protein product [Mucor hiemalis]